MPRQNEKQYCGKSEHVLDRVYEPADGMWSRSLTCGYSDRCRLPVENVSAIRPRLIFDCDERHAYRHLGYARGAVQVVDLRNEGPPPHFNARDTFNAVRIAEYFVLTLFSHPKAACVTASGLSALLP